MRKVILIGLMLLVTSICFAQCVAEIKDVKQDEIRGSIIVETQYTLNGEIVQIGRTRYDDTSGTNAEIIAKTKVDIENHCETLIKKIDANILFINTERLKAYKEKTTPIIAAIKDDLIGEKQTVTEVTETFKDKDIKVTYDEKNIVTSVIAP